MAGRTSERVSLKAQMRSLLWFLSLAVAALLATPVHAATAQPPNFVFILGEGHGWSSTSVQMDDAVPASKSAFVRTPNLEKLAQGGMRFANFYAPSPRCTPSRVSIFTGKSPAQLHMTFINEGERDSGGEGLEQARSIRPHRGTPGNDRAKQGKRSRSVPGPLSKPLEN